jgi:predicted transcriptional regulator
MMVSQRSAVLNKNLLTQSQVLVALRTISPQDLAAMDAWVDVHGTPAERQTLMASLPSLPTGDAWFWSPGWPSLHGIFKRVHVLPIETFDSGATPEPGRKRVEPKNLADIDLEALGRKMSDTIERAKAEDPRELRRRVQELERELNKRHVPVAAPAPDPAVIDRARVEGFNDALVKVQAGLALPEYLRNMARGLEGFAAAARTKADALVELHSSVRPLARVKNFEYVERSLQPVAKLRAAGVQMAPAVSRPASSENASLGGGLRRMLIALAQRNGLSAKQLGVRAGLSSKSGTFTSYIGRLKSEGCITGGRERFQITEAGRQALGNYDPLPEGRELLAYWLGELGGGAGRMLEGLARAYPRTMTAEELGEAAGLSAASGTFTTYLGKLRTLELVSGNRSELRASEELF